VGRDQGLLEAAGHDPLHHPGPGRFKDIEEVIHEDFYGD
jgi:hypothetical protein